MLGLAQEVIDLTESDSRMIYKPLPQDDPIRRKPDIKLAQEELDWYPEISLEDGLKKTIAYFKELVV